MTWNGSSLKMDICAHHRGGAPGHPVKYLFHRHCFDLGPAYCNYADWQFEKAKSLYRKNLLAHFGCVNAIEFSKNGSLLVSGGDDRRVLLWNVDRAIVSKEEPEVMQAEHLSNVFSLDFNCSSEKIFSAGNDDQVIVHDISTSAPVDYFVHEQPVYGVSADPVNESVFCSACDDGRILIYDIRESANDPFCLAEATSAFHSVMFHPVEPRLVVTANSKEGVNSYDVRMPKRVFVKYGMHNTNQCCMSARFNRLGSQILVLRRRLPPILYSTDSPTHLFQFNHRGYYNSCTMKSCSFAGINDQYVLSGSDNFDLHLWKIPKPGSDQWVNKADMVLRGHRSIVNQVRFNYTHNLIASSGVEKIVKLWSPFPLPDERGGKFAATKVNESERRIYTPDDYVSLVMQAGQGQFMSLTYEAGRKTTREDSRMLAFFDALVQRDINGLSDEDSDNFPETSYTTTVYTTPETTSSENEEEDSNPPNFRSLLSIEPPSINPTPNRHSTHSRVSVDNDGPSISVESPSSQSAVTNNVGAIVDNQDQINSDNSEDTGSAVVATRELNDHEVVANNGDDAIQPTEDRDMTANMITQLILKKESNRRKLFSISKTIESTRDGSGPGSDSESDQSSGDLQNLCPRSSTSSHDSSSRPLKVSNGGRYRGSRSTTNSYSSSRKEFRKRLLQARRLEMLSTPVYESSRNATDYQPIPTSENSYDRISDLMTRNQASQQSDSSVNSTSSSSSTDSSSSEGSKDRDQSVFNKKKKVGSSSKKSRAIISSDNSSSDSDTATPSCTSSINAAMLDGESGHATLAETHDAGGNIHKELKRKRRHPCKLNEACKALFKRYVTTEESLAEPSDEESSPYKRLRQPMFECASTSSKEHVEHVAFKKFSKQKDRNYRKVSSSIGLSTPPDSGIDVSKEQEPGCSKSFKVKNCTLALFDKNEKSPQIKHSKKETDDSTNPIDDLGFGQIDSEDESD